MENLELIKKIFSEELDIDSGIIKENSVLEELGIDSLGWTEILIELEKELDIEIDEDASIEISNFTVRDLNNLIENSK